MEDLREFNCKELRVLLKSHVNDIAAVGRLCSDSGVSLAAPGSKGAPGSREPTGSRTTTDSSTRPVRVVNGLVYPGDYVEVELVERIFKTPRGFHYFMSKTRDEDVEARGGVMSRLSISLQEMRQNRNALCVEMFGHGSTNRLDTAQRLRLAKALRSRYNSSPKQIAKLCGLIYGEVKDCL